ncbi:VOC family protein [Dyella sp. C9]|uniref:VOC family protein n=1 Tax=Dyella sp. C9 TaxID=2202154 RepID=UPI000DEF797C|nr:VOC family protein [Dyella sp. C9]
MPINRSMPPGDIIPELAYDEVPIAADWLCRAFGFRERLRIGDHRVQLVFGNASIVVTQGAGPAGASHTVMLRVADVDRHYREALSCGAQVAAPPADQPYGERQYAALDIGGHRWVFSQSIADVHPADWGGALYNVS